MNEREWAAGNFILQNKLRCRLEQTRVWGPAETLPQRATRKQAETAAMLLALARPSHVAKGHDLRKTQRTVGEFTGDEWIYGFTEGSKSDYNTGIDATWEYAGRGLPMPVPQIQLTLTVPDTGTTYVPSPAGNFPEPKDILDGLTKENFFAVWDAIVGSVRVRSIALVLPKPKELPPAPISHTQAEADRRALDAFLASRPDTLPKPRS